MIDQSKIQSIKVQLDPNVSIDNVLSIIFLVISLSAASLAVAFWHWPLVLVLAGVWLINFLLALLWLLDFTTNPQVLASLWALAVTELFWIGSRWIILYRVPKTSIMVSQLSLMIGALAYCWGGIYYHHKKQTLKRSLLFEYIVVSSIIFIALILLSRWSVVL